MEDIKFWIEQWMSEWGVTDSVWAHILVVLGIFLLAFVVDRVSLRIFVPLAAKVTRSTHAVWDDFLFSDKVVRSACHILPAIVVWWLLPSIFSQSPSLMEMLKRVTAIYLTVMTLRTVQQMISAVAFLDTEKRSTAQQYFHTFCGVLRIVCYFIATLVVISIIIGRSPMTIIAGLGATSAVLMLVFKDTIEGLVAGVRLTSNEMMHIGDWITVPRAGANGTVIGMSLTTVKVRNFDNTIVTVSPKTLVDDSFVNWKGMYHSGGRRVARKLFFDQRSIRIVDESLAQSLISRGYFTAEQLRNPRVNMSLYREFMERFLASRSDINTKMLMMVRQMEPTAYGMPLEFYFFLSDKDWCSYEHCMADIMEWAVVYANHFGLELYQVAATSYDPS